MDSTQTILIIEPNTLLNKPYIFLPSAFYLQRVASLDEASEFLKSTLPKLVIISASFPPSSTVSFLETLNRKFKQSITSIIFIVDLHHRINFIPGTTWAGQIAVIDIFIPPNDFFSTVMRLLHA